MKKLWLWLKNFVRSWLPKADLPVVDDLPVVEKDDGLKQHVDIEHRALSNRLWLLEDELRVIKRQ